MPMRPVFISYRRVDSQDAVALLCERLLKSLPDDALFRDCNSLLPGDRLTESIINALKSSIVVIAVIGPDWAVSSPGIRNQSDWVRQELEVAFAERIPVIPLLVRGANRPDRSLLPMELEGLADLLFLELRTDHNLNADFETLMTALLKHGVDPEQYRPTKVNLELSVEPCHAIPRFINEPQRLGYYYEYSQNLSRDEAEFKRALPCFRVTMWNRGVEVILTDARVNLGKGGSFKQADCPPIPFTLSSNPEFRLAQGLGVKLYEKDYFPVFSFEPHLSDAKYPALAIGPMNHIMENGIASIIAVDSHEREYFANAEDVWRTNKYLNHCFHGVDLLKRLKLIAEESHDVLAKMNRCDCPRCSEPSGNDERRSKVLSIPKWIRQLLQWK